MPAATGESASERCTAAPSADLGAQSAAAARGGGGFSRRFNLRLNHRRHLNRAAFSAVGGLGGAGSRALVQGPGLGSLLLLAPARLGLVNPVADWFESFTLIGSSESSRENSGKIFDLFSPPGPSWSPNSAPKAVLCSSARRAASSYPWPSPRRRIERFALGASRYTQIVSLSTGEEFRCLSASANGPCARSSPSFSKVDERPRLARCCWKVV